MCIHSDTHVYPSQWVHTFSSNYIYKSNSLYIYACDPFSILIECSSSSRTAYLQCVTSPVFWCVFRCPSSAFASWFDTVTHMDIKRAKTQPTFPSDICCTINQPLWRVQRFEKFFFFLCFSLSSFHSCFFSFFFVLDKAFERGATQKG
jgi:hypothetical protein